MNRLAAFALWLHARLLSLYPRRFRQKYSDEIKDVFQEAVQHAGAGGSRAILTLIARELRDWPLSCLREHLYERNQRLVQRHMPPITPWGAAAAAFPFLAPFVLSLFLPASFVILPIILTGGVIVAWFRRWPGWIAAWLGYLILYGQNWLPSFVFGSRYYNNPSPSLFTFSFSNVLLPIFWYAVIYLVIRRWPRHGLLVALPFLSLPWAFSMEFASGAMSAVVYGANILLTALFAIAIYLQRRAAADLWLLYLAATIPGAIITTGAVLFSPGMGAAWNSYGANVLQAIVPFAAILLLATVRAWSRENGPAAQRAANLLTIGLLIAFTVLLALTRLLGPPYFDHLRVPITLTFISLWLLGALFIIVGAWRLRPHLPNSSMRHLAIITILLFVLPLLQQPSFLFNTLNSLTYDQRSLQSLRDLLHPFSIADNIIAAAGVGALLVLPFAIAHLRTHTAALPKPDAPSSLRTWWRQRREQRQATAEQTLPTSSRRKRFVILAILLFLVAGGAFFGLVFLPLQLEAEPYTTEVALGDLDGDGDLDAVLGNTLRLLPNADNTILFNDGSGTFTDNGQTAGQGATGVLLLDSNLDGDLEIIVGGMVGVMQLHPNKAIDRNDRVPGFPTAPDNGASQYYMDAGDLNGDGYPDVFLAGCCGFGTSNFPEPNEWIPSANRVLFGSPSGLTDSGQALGLRGSEAVALGDLDGDGDRDAFVGNTQTNGEETQNDQPNEVWLNDGDGMFDDSGQMLGRQRTYAVALGDVDADGDLDALVGNDGDDELWLNDGQARFTLGDQSWSERRTLQVFLKDLDGDGDLDVLTAHELGTSFAWYRHAIIWWNDGAGAFTAARQRIRYRPNAALAIGDVTGDGHPDILIAALNTITIHANDGAGRFH